MPTPDFMGATGGSLAISFGAGCVATWAFIQAFLMRPINKSYERRIKSLETDNDRCNDRVHFLEMALYQHGTAEMREVMQKAFSARDLEKRDPEVAAKLADPAIWLPPNVEKGE